MTVGVKNKPPVVVPPSALKRAGFKRGQELEFKASGGVITIVPKTPSGEDYPLETVTRIVREAKENPMSRRQLAALDAEIAAYGARQAKKAGIKERDIPRLIHESRARHRTPESRPRHQHLHRRVSVSEGTELGSVDGRRMLFSTRSSCHPKSDRRTRVAEVAGSGVVTPRRTVHALTTDPDDKPDSRMRRGGQGRPHCLQRPPPSRPQSVGGDSDRGRR